MVFNFIKGGKKCRAEPRDSPTFRVPEGRRAAEKRADKVRRKGKQQK